MVDSGSLGIVFGGGVFLPRWLLAMCVFGIVGDLVTSARSFQ